MRFSHAIAASAVMLAVISTAVAQNPPAQGNVPEPGGAPVDIIAALTTPDEYAWRLFMYLNRPAVMGKAGVADPARSFGDVAGQIPMVWETWALESGRAGSEVYKPDGSAPAPWDQLPRQSRQLILDTNLERALVLRGRAGPSAKFVPTFPDDQEVRINRAGFEFISSNQMYNIDGLEALVASASKTRNRRYVQFPGGAKEIKAQWEKISDDQKPRYLWREVTNPDGSKQAFGLVSLHIITKDLANWFWADFGHVDCEAQLNACNFDHQEPALTTPIDITTRGPDGSGAGPSGHDGVRNEAMGTVWANYILRGTQTNFVEPDGRETILSNPVIENGFQQSSCITCHARAAVGARLRNADGTPQRAINHLSPQEFPLGAPERALFGDSPSYSFDEIRYLQTDFLWSPVFRAKRKTGP
jgi:hypothetical protein